jgi:hypothetical protein
MKKSLNFFALISTAVLILGISTGKIYARVTGTNPGTDVACFGPSALEVCVDVSGNILPTTTNIGSLGTSALKFKDLFLAGNASVAGTLSVTGATTQTGNLAVTGTILQVPVSTVAVVGSATINAASACGGLLRLSAVANVTTNTSDSLTIPSVANTGCIVSIVNTGGGIITLDNNSHFLYNNLAGSAADLPLGTNDGAVVVQIGTAWVVLGTHDN